MNKSILIKSLIILIWTAKISNAQEVCDDSNYNIISTLFNLIDDKKAKDLYESCAKPKLKEFNSAQLISIIQLPPSRRDSADELFHLIQPKLGFMNLEQMNLLVSSYKKSPHLGSVVEELLKRQNIDEFGITEILNASEDPVVRKSVLTMLAQLTSNINLSASQMVLEVTKVINKVSTLSEQEKRDFAADVFKLHPIRASEWANFLADDIMSLKIYSMENAPLILSEIKFKSLRDEELNLRPADLKRQINHADFLLPLFEQNLSIAREQQNLHEHFLRSSEDLFREYQKASSTLWTLVNDPVFSHAPGLPLSAGLSDALHIRTVWIVETLISNRDEAYPYRDWIKRKDAAVVQFKKTNSDLERTYINFENAVKSLPPLAAEYHKMTRIQRLPSLPKFFDAESQIQFTLDLKLMLEKHESRKNITKGLLRLGNALKEEKQQLQSRHDEVLMEQVRPDCEKLNQNLDDFRVDQFFHFWN